MYFVLFDKIQYNICVFCIKLKRAILIYATPNLALFHQIQQKQFIINVNLLFYKVVNINSFVKFQSYQNENIAWFYFNFVFYDPFSTTFFISL